MPSEWISVEERLPGTRPNSDLSPVVVAIDRDSGTENDAMYEHQYKLWFTLDLCAFEASHWQPLPEPPKERP